MSSLPGKTANLSHSNNVLRRGIHNTILPGKHVQLSMIFSCNCQATQMISIATFHNTMLCICHANHLPLPCIRHPSKFLHAMINQHNPYIISSSTKVTFACKLELIHVFSTYPYIYIHISFISLHPRHTPVFTTPLSYPRALFPFVLVKLSLNSVIPISSIMRFSRIF